MGMIKKLTAAVAMATALSAAVVAPASADISPHLVGINYLQGDAKISPDGKYLALALVNEGKRTLAIVDTKTFKGVGGVNFGRTEDVGNFFWATDERLVIEILVSTEWDKEPRFLGELYAVDYDGDHGERIFGYRAGERQVGSVRKKKESIYGWGKVVSMLPDDPKHILLSSTELPGGSELFQDKSKRDQIKIEEVTKLHSTVHRLNIHNGKMYSSQTRSPQPNTSFFTDGKGNLTYAIGGQKDEVKELYRYVDDEWKRIALNEGSMSNVLPLGFDTAYSKVFYLDYQKDGKGCLHTYDLSSGEKARVNDTCDLDADKISITANNRYAYAMQTGNAESPYQVFDTSASEGQFFAAIVDMFKGFEIDITSGSEDGTFWVVRAVDGNNATSFYLYNGESNQFSKLM